MLEQYKWQWLETPLTNFVAPVLFLTQNIPSYECRLLINIQDILYHAWPVIYAIGEV